MTGEAKVRPSNRIRLTGFVERLETGAKWEEDNDYD